MDPQRPGMKARIAFLILGMVLFTSCSSLKSGDPHMKFQKRVYDFGYAGPEQKIVHTFKFTNGGPKPFEIGKVITDCGCTAALVQENLIPPGGKGGIRVVLETPRFEGQLQKQVIVHSNFPEIPDIILTIKGIIKRDVVVVPQGINFGEIKRGDTLGKRVRLLQLSDDRLIVGRVEADKNFYRVRTSWFRGENSRGVEIDISLKPGVPLGVLNDVITLHTNVKKRPRIDVMVWADVKR
jgi:hypothetical protein